MSSNNDTDYSSESDEDEEEGAGRDADAENQQPLSWRLPPEISHSDWTIETLVNGKIHGSYPVHKNMLSVGTKRSPYFACMFDQQRFPFSESQTRTSRIELNGAAADAFPPFLDYLYSKNDELAITHDSAAALYHLGQYFGVAALQKRAKRFWKDEMTVENCAIYYDQSKLFANQKLRRAVVEVCTDDLYEIDPEDSPIFDASDIGLWLQILQAKQWEETGYLSYLISTFCTRHMDEIDAETFVELTNEQYMPTVDWDDKTALSLLMLENTIMPIRKPHCPVCKSVASMLWRWNGKTPIPSALLPPSTESISICCASSLSAPTSMRGP